jgi:hypothetical protein
MGSEKAHGDAASHFSDSASSFASLFCFPWLLSTSRLAVESLLAAPADACGRSSAVLRYLVSKGGQAPGPKRRNLNVQQLDVDRRVEGEGWEANANGRLMRLSLDLALVYAGSTGLPRRRADCRS